MQSKSMYQKKIASLILAAIMISLPLTLTALPPSRFTGDALPEVHRLSVPKPQSLVSGVESDIRISPRNETKLPLPKLPTKIFLSKYNSNQNLL